MKRMFLKGCLFCLLIIIPFISLNYLYKNTNFYKQQNDLGKFHVVPDEIQVLNLGNSHEESGIIYEGNTKVRGYNLALSSQPFEYDYYILDYYSGKLAEDATVIIPISYFDWYYNYKEIFTEDISFYNERYYSILDKEHMMNYDLKKDILYNKLALLTAGRNMEYIFADVPWTGQPIYDERVENIIELADDKYETWMQSVMATTSEKKEECKITNIKYLKKTIDYCYDNGYTPVLVTLPMTNELHSKFSDEFRVDFYSNCNSILKEYPELKYLDYSDEEKFTNNLDYFRDSDHFNTDGANAFSRCLFSDLEELGLVS